MTHASWRSREVLCFPSIDAASGCETGEPHSGMRDEGRRCEDSTVELAAASESLSGRGFVGLRRFARTFFQERRSPPNFATVVAPPLAGDPPGRHEPRDRLHGRPWVAHKLRKRPPVAVRDQFYPCIAARSIWSPAVSVPRHETSIAASADAVTSPQKTAPARKPSGGSISVVHYSPAPACSSTVTQAAAKVWKSATGTPGVVATIAAQFCMHTYGTNTAAQAADGHVAGRSQLACRRRCPPPPLFAAAGVHRRRRQRLEIAHALAG